MTNSSTVAYQTGIINDIVVLYSVPKKWFKRQFFAYQNTHHIIQNIDWLSELN